MRHRWNVWDSRNGWDVGHSYHILGDSLVISTLYIHGRQVRFSTHLTSMVEVHLSSSSSWTVRGIEVYLSASGLWRKFGVKVLMVLKFRGHAHLSHYTRSVAFGQNVDNWLLLLNLGTILHILHHHDLPHNKIWVLIIPFLHILLFVIIAWIIHLLL